MVWDPTCPFHLYCALENGEVNCFDLRLPKIPFCSFQAHDKTTSSLSFSHGVNGMLATASIDKTVKLWDTSVIQKTATQAATNAIKNNSTMIQNNPELTPYLIMYKTMNVGKLFSLQYYMDDPYVLATAGDKGSVAVWECDEAETVRNYFQNRDSLESNSLISGISQQIEGSTKKEGGAIKEGNDKEGTKKESIVITPVSVSTSMELDGHKESVKTVPIDVDESWMDEPEPDDSIKVNKKSSTSKSKNKSKDKSKKSK